MFYKKYTICTKIDILSVPSLNTEDMCVINIWPDWRDECLGSLIWSLVLALPNPIEMFLSKTLDPKQPYLTAVSVCGCEWVDVRHIVHGKALWVLTEVGKCYINAFYLPFTWIKVCGGAWGLTWTDGLQSDLTDAEGAGQVPLGGAGK